VVQQSVQPKITWVPSSIEVTLSPGASTTKDLTFTSDQNLQTVTIEPVPTLAPFLSVVPANFVSVAENQARSVRLNVAIPTNALLGTYDGKIHVRLKDQTLPQTLKVVVKISLLQVSPQELMSVTSPQQGQLFSPGDIVQVVVDPLPGVTPQG